MKTINTVLPVYDRIEKQIYERVKHAKLDKPCPVITPRYRLPAMQWNVESDNPGELTDIDLVNIATNATTAIEDYFFNGSSLLYGWAMIQNYSTFNGPWGGDPTITSAIKSVAAGEAVAMSTHRPVATFYDLTANLYRVDLVLTLNSGTAPKIALRDAATGLVNKSNVVQLVAGRNVCYLTPTTNTGAVSIQLCLFNEDTQLTNYSIVFYDCGVVSYHPRLFTDGTDYFFQYNGATLKTLLTAGTYYLKFTSLNGYVYYSDIFEVDCVYPNLITAWSNATYDTFTTSGPSITSAINLAGAARGYTSSFSVTKGETINVIFFLTINSGEIPSMVFQDGVNYLSTAMTLTEGLNNITRTMLENSDGAFLDITNANASNFQVSEVLVIRSYSEKYVRIDFDNSCDIAGIYYEGGLTQTLWLESETLEPTFPYTEKGVENGLGRFVPSYQRQDKIWLLRTKLIPQFIVDVLYRLKLHDDIDLIDTVGNEYAVKHVDVEHDWQFDDKYYALAQVSLDFDEYGLVTGCCN